MMWFSVRDTRTFFLFLEQSVKLCCRFLPFLSSGGTVVVLAHLGGGGFCPPSSLLVLTAFFVLCGGSHSVQRREGKAGRHKKEWRGLVPSSRVTFSLSKKTK